MGKKKLENLVSDYLDGTLSGLDACVLVRHLRYDPRARRYFLILSDQDLALHDHGQASVGMHETPRREYPPSSTFLRTRRWRDLARIVVAGLAADHVAPLFGLEGVQTTLQPRASEQRGSMP